LALGEAAWPFQGFQTVDNGFAVGPHIRPVHLTRLCVSRMPFRLTQHFRGRVALPHEGALLAGERLCIYRPCKVQIEQAI
jgi:hypothetical protein